jgi:hypothetical protein
MSETAMMWSGWAALILVVCMSGLIDYIRGRRDTSHGQP